MKNISKICALIAVTVAGLSFASCELDNYDGPNAQIYGEVRDVLDGSLIEQDINNGSRIIYKELGFEDPEEQRMIFKVNGEYRNNLVFAADYDIYFEESNFVIPDTLKSYRIKKGENKLDFTVQPYIRLSNVSIKKEGNEIVATFTITPTVGNNVSRIGLFAHIDYVAGEPYAHERVVQDINESFKDNSRTYTLRMPVPAGQLKAGKEYYFRVGAQIDFPNGKYNYAPAVRLTI